MRTCITAPKRRGQALILVTMSLFFVFGLMGMAVDLGWAYFRREAAQTAADAGAAAVVRGALATSASSQACGSGGVWCGSPAGTETACPATAPTTASTSFDNGCMLAAANGFKTTGAQRVTIQANVTTSAPTVPGTTVTYWATVRIRETSKDFFGLVGAHNAFASSARATSAITSGGGTNTNPCIYVLSPHGSAAMQLGNAAQITTSSCGVYVNSDDGTKALWATGGAKLTSPTVKVTGHEFTDNGGSIVGTISHPAATTDPFAGLGTPTAAGGCLSGNFTNWQATPYTPAPGNYCSGFTVGNGMSAIMQPGVYVVSGGSFSVQGGSTLSASGGVLIYLSGSSAYVSFANSASVTLSAQTTGAYQGILFYQDRTVGSPTASSFAGGASMHLSGSLYFPKAGITMDNGSNTQVLGIVAYTLNFQGGATIQQSSTQSQTGLATGGLSNSFIE